ncbi:hypothetical protein [Massilia sp. METH4]|uniref:hypothetical protein n=1 Tax=Massilia sp. METH4 TaxID=3123041 RepID=UPI0030D4F284
MSRLSLALVSKVPAGLSACSAIVYFACSEGIRNHLLMLWQAAHAVAEHLR